MGRIGSSTQLYGWKAAGCTITRSKKKRDAEMRGIRERKAIDKQRRAQVAKFDASPRLVKP